MSLQQAVEMREQPAGSFASEVSQAISKLGCTIRRQSDAYERNLAFSHIVSKRHEQASDRRLVRPTLREARFWDWKLGPANTHYL